jgi:hypothetical protein
MCQQRYLITKLFRNTLFRVDNSNATGIIIHFQTVINQEVTTDQNDVRLKIN